VRAFVCDRQFVYQSYNFVSLSVTVNQSISPWRSSAILVDWALWRGLAFRPTGPGMSSARDGIFIHWFHARHLGQPGPGWAWPEMIFTPGVQADRARDDRGLQILSRSRCEKYWGLNFGSFHTPMWGRLSTKGNRPEEVITPVPWAHYRNSIK
jgi:hypothetical protein